MDSMDWFDPATDAAKVQIRALNHTLKLGGRVLLRSAALRPWYIAHFEALGFTGRRVGARLPGTCIDRYVRSISVEIKHINKSRVNMYASTWILTKTINLTPSAVSWNGLENLMSGKDRTSRTSEHSRI